MAARATMRRIASQTWTLTKKNLLIVFVRHWLSTLIRAFFGPVIFMFFMSYSKNFFIPPATYGFGSPTGLRSFQDALGSATGGRDTVAFVNNGFTGGQISGVIDTVADTVRAAGKRVEIVESDNDLLTTCRSSLRGVSTCFGAANFHSSPEEGPGDLWNYTLRSDGSFGENVFVDETDNDQEIYILPFQHAIDAAIASAEGTQLPDDVDEYIYTDQTQEERDDAIQRAYMNSIIDIVGVAFFIGMVGVVYQLTGHMALERELGISQLIEAMTPNQHRWHTQLARLLASHLAFDIVYLPGWIIMSLFVARLVYPSSSVAILIFFHILAGLSLSSWSILGAALFKRAQLSGITITIASLILAIISQVAGPSNSGAAAILALLFPPMNYTLFILYLAYWEHENRAGNLIEGAPGAPFQLPGIALWIFLIIQTLVFPVLGAFVERGLYGTASRARKINFEDTDSSTAVKLNSFSKMYGPSWWQRNVMRRLGATIKEEVRAVNDLSFSALRGEILVLLGANGSGKSTTLDCVAGLNTVSGGTIEVDGIGGLGYCPQKNVLWDELTVFEHVKIFNSLKSMGTKASKHDLKELISACDLELKIDAASKTLSGGQKRKLQLAVMFTGGSRVCCIDEVSSGLDPLSRRKIWDILIAQRGKRTLLFTTHFLDEADRLSDHITILSKGDLKAEGSAVELKHKFGGGYRVIIYNNLKTKLPEELDMYPKRMLYDHTEYQLADSPTAAVFVKKLEGAGIMEYQVNGPTIEDVFLKLAQEVNENVEEGQAQEGDEEISRKGDSPDGFAPQSSSSAEKKVARSDDEAEEEFQTGRGTTLARQTWILFRKRITILRHNKLPYLAALLVPIITAGLVTFFIRGFEGLSCSPESQASDPRTLSLQRLALFNELEMTVGPPDRVDVEQLARRLQVNTSAFNLVDSFDAFQSSIRNRYANVTPGGFFLGDTPTMAYVGNREIAYSALTQSVFDSVFSDTNIATQYQRFAVPFSPDTGDSLQMILYFGLAMSAYPAFFALYPTTERLRKVRALHYSNGIRAAPLWIAYLCFDFVFVMVISAVAIGIFIGVSDIWYYPGYLFLVFFLYGLASILMVYIVSLFVISQLAAFAFAAGGQASLFGLYMCIVTYVSPDAIDSSLTIAHFVFAVISPAANMMRSLLLTLNEFQILCRDRELASYPGAIKVYGGPILYLIVQAIVFGIFLIWWDSGSVPSFLDFTNRRRTPDPESKHSDIDPAVTAEAQRVIDDPTDPLRVLHVSKAFTKHTLAVDDITFGVPRGDVFALLGPNGAGKSTTISLIRGDLKPSPVPAGSYPAGPDVLVDDTSISRHRAAARAHLGVCPQFDACDTMTVAQHLAFYARARGVRDPKRAAATLARAVGLAAQQKRPAAALSGGNRRKLSLAIALAGNPSVLVLDEPSSGMDAASKRVMWRTLRSARVSAGRALLITTHSMEEADALAHRAGIMAGRMLALGSSEQLRDRHGDRVNVHVVRRDAPRTPPDEMARVRDWVERKVPGAVIEGGMWHGQLRFSVGGSRNSGSGSGDGDVNGDDATTATTAAAAAKAPRRGYGDARMGIAELFALLEASRDEIGSEYYSVSQSTLDQVFLSIVGRHNVEEEDSGAGGKGKAKGKGKGTRSGWRWGAEIKKGLGALTGRAL
ncbi:putative ABC transporter [Lineolata rhizophorae]|uniref:Putative ABC transporter n=1 Tax=Lineolata rhizophorae TaxID=578093 RepID=A0A6A6P994_9PEZI|nr:putative ABC transporter [Lineolata rhizophorae]